MKSFCLGTPLCPTGEPIPGRTEIDLQREPGFGWTLSPEARAQIDEMERANAVAVAQLLARGTLVGDAPILPAPAKCWRNWWRVKQRLDGVASLAPIEASDLVHVFKDYPSKDVAETHARADMIERFAKRGVTGSFDHILEFAGAYPVGELPKQEPCDVGPR